MYQSIQLTRTARKVNISANPFESLFFSPSHFFCNSVRFSLLERMKRNTRTRIGSMTSTELKQQNNIQTKTIKTLHSLVAGLRPAKSILAQRIAYPLLLVGAGLILVQPCAGASFKFEETGSLLTARAGHTATLLPNGKVLVAAGLDSNFVPLTSAELYDPATGTWTATGSLAAARYDHTATLLPNGKVLVAGGSFALASAELYDPVRSPRTPFAHPLCA
jgi:hypothetical protein